MSIHWLFLYQIPVSSLSFKALDNCIFLVLSITESQQGCYENKLVCIFEALRNHDNDCHRDAHEEISHSVSIVRLIIYLPVSTPAPDEAEVLRKKKNLRKNWNLKLNTHAKRDGIKTTQAIELCYFLTVGCSALQLEISLNDLSAMVHHFPEKVSKLRWCLGFQVETQLL